MAQSEKRAKRGRPRRNSTVAAGPLSMEAIVGWRLAALEKELKQLHHKIDIVATIGFTRLADSSEEDNHNKAIVGLLEAHPNVTYQEVGDVVGLSKGSVHQIAKQAGLSRNKKPRHYCSHITVEKVLELYHKNLLIKDIAQALGCNYATVCKRLRAAGIGKAECYSRSMKLDWRGKRGAKATARTKL